MKKLIHSTLSAALIALIFSCNSASKSFDRQISFDPSSRNIPKKTTKQTTVTPTKTVATSTKRTVAKEETVPEEPSSLSTEKKVISSHPINNIINVAKSYKGTPYRFGGTTAQGLDCSGLMNLAFEAEGINLPRVSRDIAAEGFRISLHEAKAGDLVFFKTNPRRNVINHVGLVVEVFLDKIYFIHSSSSRGVIISSLEETYWKNNFTEIRRVIN